MAESIFNYDKVSDTLYICFAPNQKATGIELNENILLRLDKRAGKAIGLTIFNFSILAQQTEVGPRSFPLTGLAELSVELKKIVLAILLEPPIKNFLLVSAYMPSFQEIIPITSLRHMESAGVYNFAV